MIWHSFKDALFSNQLVGAGSDDSKYFQVNTSESETSKSSDPLIQDQNSTGNSSWTDTNFDLVSKSNIWIVFWALEFGENE